MAQISESDIGLMYDVFVDKIYRFLYYKVLSKEIAEDLTSEVFVSFALACKKNNQIENPKSYLWGIVRKVFLRYLTRKYKEAVFVPLDENNFAEYAEDFTTESSKPTSLEDIAKKHIAKLPEKQRIILDMRLLQKKSLNQICNELNKDMNYVKTTQRRGISNLKKLVECTL